MRSVLVALTSLLFVVNVNANSVVDAPEVTQEVADISAATTAEQNTPMKPVVAPSKSETEIPVVLDAKAANTDSAPISQKVLLVFSIMGVLILTTWMLGRKYLKKGAVLTQSHQIKILSQSSLGPKKSLAVVRVAGESVLIGITDTQISMIKSLSLLDEDFPEQTPVRFENALRKTEMAAGPVDADSFSFSSLKSQVSSKLQSMKVIE